MKHFFLLLTIGCFFHTHNFCQDSIPNPEFSERPYYLTQSKLLNLERADAVFELNVKAGGYGGAEYYYTAFGERSTVRFSQDSLPRIFITLSSGIDPTERIVIIRSTVKAKKDRRRFIQGGSGSAGNAKNVNEYHVSYTIRTIRPNIYEIIFDEGLLPGEYAIMPINSPNGSALDLASQTVKITCFGIDASTSDQGFQENQNDSKNSLENNKTHLAVYDRPTTSYIPMVLGLAPFYRTPTTRETPLFTGSYEYGINERIGISGHIGYGKRKSFFENKSYISFGLGLHYYLFHSEKMDFYVKGGLGFWDQINSSLNGARPIIQVGTHVILRDPISFNIEMGYGLTIVNVGLAYQLNKT